MLLVERKAGSRGCCWRPCPRNFAADRAGTGGLGGSGEASAISGRSRKEQIRLASEMGIEGYPIPAGGCLLTEPSFLSKIRDVFDHADTLNMLDFALLRTGRHFRIGARTKAIIGPQRGGKRDA